MADCQPAGVDRAEPTLTWHQGALGVRASPLQPSLSASKIPACHLINTKAQHYVLMFLCKTYENHIEDTIQKLLCCGLFDLYQKLKKGKSRFKFHSWPWADSSLAEQCAFVGLNGILCLAEATQPGDAMQQSCLWEKQNVLLKISDAVPREKTFILVKQKLTSTPQNRELRTIWFFWKPFKLFKGKWLGVFCLNCQAWEISSKSYISGKLEGHRRIDR